MEDIISHSHPPSFFEVYISSTTLVLCTHSQSVWTIYICTSPHLFQLCSVRGRGFHPLSLLYLSYLEYLLLRLVKFMPTLFVQSYSFDSIYYQLMVRQGVLPQTLPSHDFSYLRHCCHLSIHPSITDFIDMSTLIKQPCDLP